jgi:putative transposase
MTVTSSIDPARLLEEQLAQASPICCASCCRPSSTRCSRPRPTRCAAPSTAHQPVAGQPSQRLPTPRLRHPCRHGRCRGPEAADRLVLPGVTARTPQAGQTGADVGGSDLVPARGVHPGDGQAGAVVGHHHVVESQVSEMAKELDTQVEEFRTRRLDDAGPFTLVTADASS